MPPRMERGIGSEGRRRHIFSEECPRGVPNPRQLSRSGGNREDGDADKWPFFGGALSDASGKGARSYVAHAPNFEDAACLFLPFLCFPARRTIIRGSLGHEKF